MSLLDAIRIGLQAAIARPDTGRVADRAPFELSTGAQVLRLDEELAPEALDQFE